MCQPENCFVFLFTYKTNSLFLCSTRTRNAFIHNVEVPLFFLSWQQITIISCDINLVLSNQFLNVFLNHKGFFVLWNINTKEDKYDSWVPAVVVKCWCYDPLHVIALLDSDECPSPSCVMSAEVARPVSLFRCRVGEGRAYWSLGNAHTALGNHQQAMYFAEKHLEIAQEVTVYCLPSSSECNQHKPLGHSPLYWLSGEEQGIMPSLYAAFICTHSLTFCTDVQTEKPVLNSSHSAIVCLFWIDMLSLSFLLH